MKTFPALVATAFLSATALAAVAIPTAASAQPELRFGSDGYWTPERSDSIRRQIWNLNADIDEAIRSHAVRPAEGMRLHNLARSLRASYEASRLNGLTFREVRQLQVRVNNIRSRLHLNLVDWDREDYWRGNSWRDRDGDGVPNRIDGDRDNDGVPNRVDPRPNRPY